MDNVRPRSADDLNIGDGVLLCNGFVGTIKAKLADSFGVECNQRVPNGHNGEMNGKKSFECSPQHGLFVNLDQIICSKLQISSTDKGVEYSYKVDNNLTLTFP